MALLIHHRDGGIYSECSASLNAVRRLRESGFIRLSINMFEEGFAVCKGASPEKYNAATRKVLNALADLEAVMNQYGRHVAGDTILKLFNDVMRIQERIQFHDPDEVLDWLRRMEAEMEAYAGRMASQIEAAFDPESFAELCGRVANAGFSVTRSEAMHVPGHHLPLAWALTAVRN